MISFVDLILNGISVGLSIGMGFFVVRWGVSFVLRALYVNERKEFYE